MRDYSGLLEGLSAGIADLTTSEKWTQYLDVQSKFYRYSPNNVMLILMQNPYATRVAGYRAWQALDHQVMAKESALRILAPMTYKRDDAPEGEKAREIRGFKLVPVFDISQTEGPDLPDIVSKLEGLAPEGVFAKLTEFAQGIGFRVERPQSLDSGANGDTSHSEGRIRVVSSNSEAQQAKTLAHEIGHALLHDPGVEATKDLERGLKELEAESTAYVICTALGMDTSDYSFGYVAGWAGGAPEATQGIKASTGRIQKAATAVLKTFEVEEPAVEATNDVSIEVAIERSIDVDTTLVVGERRTEDLVDLDCIQEIADASDGRIQVLSVDLSLRDAPASAYQPLSAAQLDVLDCPADMWRELGV
jgi:antirestriction protein ArdC